MNYKKWAHTEPHSFETRLAKIIEEVGEAAAALLELQKAKSRKDPRKAGVKHRRAHLVEELQHVEFQAQMLRMAVQLHYDEEHGL